MWSWRDEEKWASLAWRLGLCGACVCLSCGQYCTNELPALGIAHTTHRPPKMIMSKPLYRRGAQDLERRQEPDCSQGNSLLGPFVERDATETIDIAIGLEDANRS